jgi:hypothetical protein
MSAAGVLSLGMLLPPFLAICIIFIALSLGRKLNWVWLRAYYILTALFLAAINSTKKYESDLLEYYERYQQVSSTQLFEYVGLGFGGAVREPLFKYITYGGYFVTGGNFAVFLFLFSLALYLLQFHSIQKFCKNSKISPEVAFFSISVLAFLPQYFSLSAHILRQMLATALILYFLVSFRQFGIFGRSLLMISAILIHSSTIIFLPAAFLLRNRFGYIGVIILGLEVLLLIKSQGLSYLSVALGDNYIAGRISNSDSFIEVQDGAGLPAGLLYLVYLMLILSAYGVYIRRMSGDHLILLNAITLVSVIVISTSNITLLQYRYFFMIYSFIPFFLAVFIPVFIPKRLNALIPLFVITMFVNFLFFLPSSHWQYNNLELTVAGNPIMVLFFGRFE